MNTLSWLIYAAEVVGNLQVMVSIVTPPLLIFGGVGLTSLWAYNVLEKTGYRPTWPTGAWVASMSVCAAIAIFTPSTKALYMIAASEAGETIVTSPDAIEMMGDLKAIIKKRLKEELGE